jgi:uroporphyrinogen III methyltransferase / synthase
MTVYLVGAGPGDPGLLTQRGAALLAEADVVLYDRLVHHSVLALAPESAELIDVGKRPDAHRSGRAQQDEIDQLLIEHGRRSHTVVRLKGGDPYLFGRGGEEAEVLTLAGVPWEVVPGVSSAFSVPAVVGIPVTHRGVSSSVTVVTGRVDDPKDGVNWEALAKVDGTLVILMGMMNRVEIAEALQRGGKPGSTPIAVIERGTTPDQMVVRTTLDQLSEVALGSPAVIVVGPVAALGSEGPGGAHGSGGADPSPLPHPAPLLGRSIVVTRSGPRGKRLVAALHAAGARTISAPLTEQIGPHDGGAALRAAAHNVKDFRWIVFTSVNAVTRFMGELPDARALGTTLVAAVGPATADALRGRGVEPDLVPSDHRAVGLVAEFPGPGPGPGPDPGSPGNHGSPGNLVLFPCADQAAPIVPDSLSKKGWEVRRVEAYQTVALPPPEPEVRQRMAASDAVVFAAASSAEAYAALKGPDGSSLPVPPLVVCIGPTTAERARALGMAGVERAGGQSSEDIVAALVQHLGDPDARR